MIVWCNHTPLGFAVLSSLQPWHHCYRPKMHWHESSPAYWPRNNWHKHLKAIGHRLLDTCHYCVCVKASLNYARRKFDLGKGGENPAEIMMLCLVKGLCVSHRGTTKHGEKTRISKGSKWKWNEDTQVRAQLFHYGGTIIPHKELVLCLVKMTNKPYHGEFLV